MLRATRESCPSCAAVLATPPIFSGAEIRCPRCGEHVVPRPVLGATIAQGGCEQSFGDFASLIEDNTTDVAPLLDAWFGCVLVREGRGVTITDMDGRYVYPPFLHALIQADPEKQGRIYNLAMNLWH
jgi:predicted RNA-binding Zn-ribbon protein involved in translation (DUF1610 family)